MWRYLSPASVPLMNISKSEIGDANIKQRVFAMWPAYLSTISAVAYFVTSEGIRYYLQLLNKAVSKVIFLIANHL